MAVLTTVLTLAFVRSAHKRYAISERKGAAMAADHVQHAEEVLEIEEADAWSEYLEATRNQSEIRYPEIEPWAWARLNQRLKSIRRRREKLHPQPA